MKTVVLMILVVVFISTPLVNGAEEPSMASGTAAARSNFIVARGKGFQVSRREVDQVLATAVAKNPDDKLPADAELRVLTHLIEIRLVFVQATDEEKAEGKKKADADFPNIIKTLGEAEFQRRLKATGMTADELRVMLFQESTAQASLTRQLGINITEVEAKNYFDEHPGIFDEPEKAHIRELLLLTTAGYTSDSLPEPSVQAKHKEIFELRERVCHGEDFTALARRYDESFISRDSGGECTFARDQVEREMGDLAFSMRPGDVSEVITNEDGFVFFQLLEIVPAQKGEFANLSGRIKRALAGAQKQRLAPAYIRQLWRDANVEIFDSRLRAERLVSEAQAEQSARAAAQITSTNWPSASP